MFVKIYFTFFTNIDHIISFHQLVHKNTILFSSPSTITRVQSLSCNFVMISIDLLLIVNHYNTLFFPSTITCIRLICTLRLCILMSQQHSSVYVVLIAYFDRMFRDIQRNIMLAVVLYLMHIYKLYGVEQISRQNLL